MEKTQLPFEIQPQPTETTCGPTCLHAVYKYYNDNISLTDVINEAQSFEEGGTLAVFLACHALKRGYKATIYTYNVQVFDPTWFNQQSTVNISDKLRRQAICKPDPKLQIATKGYLEFLNLGGQLKFRELSPSLIRKYLNKEIPIITGLSATFLHRSAREHPFSCEYDDLCGLPSGHFVVLYGYNKLERSVSLA